MNDEWFGMGLSETNNSTNNLLEDSEVKYLVERDMEYEDLLAEASKWIDANANKIRIAILVRTQEGGGRDAKDLHHGVSIKVNINKKDKDGSPFIIDPETKSGYFKKDVRDAIAKSHNKNTASKVEKAVTKFAEDNFDDIMAIWKMSEKDFYGEKGTEAIDRLKVYASEM